MIILIGMTPVQYTFKPAGSNVLYFFGESLRRSASCLFDHSCLPASTPLGMFPFSMLVQHLPLT